VAILARLDLRQLQLGRGEAETLLGSTIFSAQILWLERPRFARNNVGHATLVMFVVITLVTLPVSLFHTHNARDWWAVFSSGAACGFVSVLIVFCTLIAYLLMNRWQPRISATEAGLIYCTEPVFASVLALFMPAWFSALAEVNYANETLSANLLAGGGLITLANVLIQRRLGQSSPSLKPGH
jgi:drug/metabolite transporter (DMT)-like permease